MYNFFIDINLYHQNNYLDSLDTYFKNINNFKYIFIINLLI